ADRVLGPFINTLPVRARTGGVGVRDAVEAMRSQLAALLEHEHAPLAVAQQASGVAGNLPLFTSLFNYRHVTGGQAERSAPEPAGGSGIRSTFTQERSNYPMIVSVNDAESSELSVSVEVAASVDPIRVGRLLRNTLEQVVDVLGQVLDGGTDTDLDKVGVLDAEEFELVVRGWNDTAVPVGGESVLGLFGRWVAQTPAAVAVVADGVELTFAELDVLAGRFAAYLGSCGVGPESVVGLRLPRGVEMVAAIVGVWKAGAAYLPIDPGLPADRVAFMVADCGVGLVVDGQLPLAEMPVP
ncbi:AMP-binding protein, partial [Plantactinospora solaniradicis]